MSKLRKEADKVFSIWIRERDEWVCFTCGTRVEDLGDWKQRRLMHAGHYVSRTCLALRYEEKNVHAQCWQCNIAKKGNYPVYAIKMIDKYGEQFLRELDRIYRGSKAVPFKYGREFYENIIKKYKTV